MISVEDVEKIHQILIKEFGGSLGTRDAHALSAAIARPYQTFDGKELYPSLLEKAAVLIESMLSNHPFVDGNKRTGYVLMRLFLIENGIDIIAGQDEKYNFVINIASGKSNFDDILSWLLIHTASSP